MNGQRRRRHEQAGGPEALIPPDQGGGRRQQGERTGEVHGIGAAEHEVAGELSGLVPVE